jgi:hypothetical protein
VIILAVLLPTAAVVITYLFILEVIKYRAGTLLVSPRRFRLRFAAWLLALLLCATVLTAMFLPRSFTQTHLSLSLGLWSLGLAMAIALIWIMLADIQEVEDRIKAREQEIWRDFARMLAARGGACERGDQPEKQEPSKE